MIHLKRFGFGLAWCACIGAIVGVGALLTKYPMVFGLLIALLAIYLIGYIVHETWN